MKNLSVMQIFFVSLKTTIRKLLGVLSRTARLMVRQAQNERGTATPIPGFKHVRENVSLEKTAGCRSGKIEQRGRVDSEESRSSKSSHHRQPQ